ncbi:MAG: MarR family transcriptional regulator [Bdellovibrionales bacterium]|nr:MarR family transcriptional regulator [Bdellovibrionales bacterium]
MGKENWLLLDNQLCFRLYSASKTITSAYANLLKPLDLTYPQYLTMLVLWEQGEVSVKDLGERLNLDSGTLSPLLKKLEAKEIVSRIRQQSDERSVHIKLTKKGLDLKKKALGVPAQIACKMDLNMKEIIDLQKKLDSLLTNLNALSEDA